jgi:hypothetical protein
VTGRLARLLLALLAVTVGVVCVEGAGRAGTGAGARTGTETPAGGVADDGVRELTAWSVVTPSGASHAVTLPADFASEDIDADGQVVLETSGELPPAWRDGPLALAIPLFPGAATLEVDGQRVASRELAFAHTWRLTEVARTGRPLALRLALDARMNHALMVVPRLSATTDGDARFASIATFNLVSTIAGTGMVGFVTVLYLALFLFDRRRSAHGWFALQATMAMPIAAYALWSASVRPYTNAVIGLLLVVVVPAATGFLRTYLRWPRVPRVVWPCTVGVALSSLADFSAHVRPLGTTVRSVFVTVWIVVMVAALVREARAGRDRFAPATFAIAWLVLVGAYLPDVQLATTGGAAMAGGFIGVPTGLAAFALLQAVVLGRDHIRTLREAEARVQELEVRGRELEARGRELEARSREIGQLNEELRHQVAERSRELTEGLARSEVSVAPTTLEVGDVFDGRYRVTRALGRGGMGAVYEVERTRDARALALKVVTREVTGRAAARFAQEAEIGARIRHANLVSIVDVGIAMGTPFLVMELVHGGSMEERRARFGDARWALPLLRQIAAGLAELHANRIVHRDLKPGNVLLVEADAAEAVAKISDFGISKFGAIDDSTDVDGRGATLPATPMDASPRDLTQTGVLMGTPLYMPPEALSGPARHPSADVFSLGVLAYEALTGHAPFAIPAILLARARQPLPEPEPLAGVSADVAALVLACLRAEPTERPRAKELVAGLV